MKDELPAGTIIGNDYRVIKTLGRGGFGITYKCEDIRLKLILAVKEYFPEGMAKRVGKSLNIVPTDNAEDIFLWGRKKFLLEGTTLAAIQHKYSSEYIVKIIRFVEERGTAYLAMEFIDGMQIDEFASSNRITSAQQVEGLFQSLCTKALKPIHDSNFYHRDIKPGNILIRNSNNEPVIIDFGAARQTAGGKSTVALLTPRYSAVEQYASQEDMEGDNGQDLCGSFTDIYSLAATFYFIIKGEPPQDAPSRLLDENTEDLFGDVSLSNYSPEFLKQIDWGMCSIPKNRPQTISEWLNKGSEKSKVSSPKSRSDESGGRHNEPNIMAKSKETLNRNRKEVGGLLVAAAITLAIIIFPESKDTTQGQIADTPKEQYKIQTNVAPTTKKVKSTSWTIGIDATEWTSMNVLAKLSTMQEDPNGSFQLKLHAWEPFRVKTQKGLAMTKAEAKDYGGVKGEIYLKSVNGLPQEVRVEIIHNGK